MGMLYHTMLAVTDAIICILDQIYDLRNSASADMHVATEGIGPILDLINPFRQYLVLLSVAVVVPGVLAALFMFLSSLCACGHHYCGNRLAGCSKFFLMITYIFIILSFVIGVVATALGPLIQVFGEEQITMVTAICETTLPVLEQTLYDSRTAMSNAMATGAAPASVTDLNTLLLAAEEPVEIFGIACGCLVKFFNTAVDLFSPGICNIIASIFALYASCFSCWTTGCCVAPHTAKTSQVTSAGMIFGLCFGSECLLLRENFGVLQELVRWGAEHVQLVAVFGLPQLVVGLGGDVLVGILLVVGEVGAGNMLGVEERRCAEATRRTLRHEDNKGSGVSCRW
jgi:hypothetical protein